MPSLYYQMYAAMDRGSRNEQQDAVNSSFPERQKELGVLCVLADGMGGLEAGGKAALTVVQTMVDVFHSSPASDAPEQILLRGCSLSQQAVRRMQRTPGECGATLAALLIRNDRCSFLSVGDSRLYLFRAGGLIPLNRAHNKLARIDRQIGLGRLPEEARTDAERAALTAYIGMESLEQVDRSSHSFAAGPRDRFLLVSDGVYHALSEEEITEIMTLPGEAATITMITRVMEKRLPKQDNCTAAVVDCLPGAV